MLEPVTRPGDVQSLPNNSSDALKSWSATPLLCLSWESHKKKLLIVLQYEQTEVLLGKRKRYYSMMSNLVFPFSCSSVGQSRLLLLFLCITAVYQGRFLDPGLLNNRVWYTFYILSYIGLQVISLQVSSLYSKCVTETSWICGRIKLSWSTIDVKIALWYSYPNKASKMVWVKGWLVYNGRKYYTFSGWLCMK